MSLMRWKFDGGIKTVWPRILNIKRPRCDEIKVPNTNSDAIVSPAFGCCLGVRKQRHAIDNQNRLAVDTYIARITQRLLDVFDESDVIILRVILRQKHVVFLAIPATCPTLIRPAKTKRKIKFRIL
jgi:hypothetical protein